MITQEKYDKWVEMKLKEARKDDPGLVYYYEHKDEIKARRNAVKVNCECGGKWSNLGKRRHFKSLIHQNWIKENNLPQEQTVKKNPRYLKTNLYIV